MIEVAYGYLMRTYYPNDLLLEKSNLELGFSYFIDNILYVLIADMVGFVVGILIRLTVVRTPRDMI
jgi:hypothetical protein